MKQIILSAVIASVLSLIIVNHEGIAWALEDLWDQIMNMLSKD